MPDPHADIYPLDPQAPSDPEPSTPTQAEPSTAAIEWKTEQREWLELEAFWADGGSPTDPITLRPVSGGMVDITIGGGEPRRVRLGDLTEAIAMLRGRPSTAASGSV